MSECGWTQDDPECDTWGTDCGHYFTLNHGTPAENRMIFCCYCGARIKEQAATCAEASDDR